MIRNVSALLAQLGRPLVAARVKRLVLQGTLEPEPLITYLLFDQWLSIISTDEQTSIHIDPEPPVGTKADDGGFAYRIEPIAEVFPEFEIYIGQPLKAISELVNSSGSFGIKLYFANGRSFAVWNEDYPGDANHYLFGGQLPAVVVEVPVE